MKNTRILKKVEHFNQKIYDINKIYENPFNRNPAYSSSLL